MNVADAELMGGVLKRDGHVRVDDPAEAEVLIVNTCAIRDHAEQRVIGRIGQLNRHKLERGGVRLGVAGCVAKELGKQLLELAHVDFVIGPDGYRHLPEVLDRVDSGERVVLDRFNRSENYEDLEPYRIERCAAWVTIMRGCDKFCSYCIVPFTRGRENQCLHVTIRFKVVKNGESEGGGLACASLCLTDHIHACEHEGDYACLNGCRR